MSQDNVFLQILEDSKNCLHRILATNVTTDVDGVILLAHQISFTHTLPTFPYFANRDFKYMSPFAETWIRRWRRIGLIQPDRPQLTRRGRLSAPTSPIEPVPTPSSPSIHLPFSSIPPITLNLGSRTVRVRPQIGDIPLVMTALLPADPTFFLIFSHFDRDGMRTTYPLLKQDNTYLCLFMGDIRNIVAVPQPSLVERCYQNLISYLSRYANNFEMQLKMVVYLLLSVSKIRFIHLCGSRMKLLSGLNDKIQWMLDFDPTCEKCRMESERHENFVSLRHSLGHAWEKGVLSELFFAKLLTQIYSQLDRSIEVYPRLTVQGLPHECDVFVKRNNTVLLFELKRSSNYDGRCEVGTTQLRENKQVLERWGLNCVSVLVTNMTTRSLPHDANVDEHLIPVDIMNLDSKLQSLVS